MILNKNLESALNRHKVVKIIIGLSNFNLSNIIFQAKAAEIGGATYIDIASNINIINELKQIYLYVCRQLIQMNCLHVLKLE